MGEDHLRKASFVLRGYVVRHGNTHSHLESSQLEVSYVWDLLYLVINYNRKESGKLYIYIYIYIYKTESLCCTHETINQLYFNEKQKHYADKKNGVKGQGRCI